MVLLAAAAGVALAVALSSGCSPAPPGPRPPRLRILSRTSAAAHGDLFVGAKAGPGQDGALIYDEHGRLVFFHRVPGHTSALDVRAQQYQGKPVLTWWQGPV